MRNPENALYDAACELLCAAQRFERAAAAARAQPAVPATLGCLAASLRSVTAGCALLHRNARQVPSQPFDDLVRALRQAERTCDTARSRSAELVLERTPS